MDLDLNVGCVYAVFCAISRQVIMGFLILSGQEYMNNLIVGLFRILQKFKINDDFKSVLLLATIWNSFKR